jgi:leader peptidase (prepilin peptidase) / N-methyltransferase
MSILIITIPLGLLLGFIVNYFCDVLPVTRKIGKPVCVHCQESLSWKAYFFSTRCTECKEKYSIRRYVVLFIFPAIISWIWIFPPERFTIGMGIILLTYSAVIFVIDLENKAILLPTIWVGLGIFLILGIQLHGFTSTIIGGSVGFLIMLALHYSGHIYAQWLAKKRKEILDEPALGMGDVNLSGVIGLGLGWPGVMAGLFIAIMLGGIASLIYLVISKLSKSFKIFQAIPYAPFLVLSVLYLLFR